MDGRLGDVGRHDGAAGQRVLSALLVSPVTPASNGVLSARIFLGGRFSAPCVSLQARVEEVLDRLDGGNDLGSEEGYAAAMERAYPLG